jgi:hypothetical protein
LIIELEKKKMVQSELKPWERDMTLEHNEWLSNGVSGSIEKDIETETRPMLAMIMVQEGRKFHYFWYLEGDNNRYHHSTNEWHICTEEDNPGVHYLHDEEPVLLLMDNYRQRFSVGTGSRHVRLLLPSNPADDEDANGNDEN